LYGDLNFHGHSIKNLVNPEKDTDVVNKKYVNSFVHFKERIPVVLIFTEHDSPQVSNKEVVLEYQLVLD